jgi:hypothetical protein
MSYPTKEEYDQHFKDLDGFIKEWDKNKKCKCENPECKHYNSAYQKTDLFLDGIELFNRALLSNAKTFQKCIKTGENEK